MRYFSQQNCSPYDYCLYSTHNQCINARTQLCNTVICLVFVYVSIRYFSCALSKCQLVYSTVTLAVTHTQSCCHRQSVYLSVCLPAQLSVCQRTCLNQHTNTRKANTNTNTYRNTNTFQTFDTCSTGRRKTTQPCLLSRCRRLELLLLDATK